MNFVLFRIGVAMDVESIRPVLSGLLGSALSIPFCHALSRWVPQICNGKSAATLVRENRVAIWTANAFFFGGILVGIAIYRLGLLANSDWRGLALGAGGGSLAALLALPLLAFATGRNPKEAYVAYAISQRTPTLLVYGILMLCIGSFVAAMTSLLAA